VPARRGPGPPLDPALIPTAPAILGAIRDATGVRIDHVPATPVRVLQAILAARKVVD
jgi:hypothetical protein